MWENCIHADSVYLSLGDREEKARNPVMATVGACIREVRETLKNLWGFDWRTDADGHKEVPRQTDAQGCSWGAPSV